MNNGNLKPTWLFYFYPLKVMVWNKTQKLFHNFVLFSCYSSTHFFKRWLIGGSFVGRAARNRFVPRLQFASFPFWPMTQRQSFFHLVTSCPGRMRSVRALLARTGVTTNYPVFEGVYRERGKGSVKTVPSRRPVPLSVTVEIAWCIVAPVTPWFDYVTG